MVLAPNCNSNLILLGKVCKSKITYYDKPIIIILMKNEKIIALAKKEQNFFILDLVHPNKTMATISLRVMAMTGQRQLIHLVSQNNCIYLWHWYLVYITNVCIIRASKLVDSINFNIKNKKYKLAEVIIDSNTLDFNINSNSYTHNPHNMQPIPKMAYIIKKNNNINLLNKLCIVCVASKFI